MRTLLLSLIVMLPLMAQVANTPYHGIPIPAPATPASTTTSYMPTTYFSLGGGALIPGSGKFGYESVSTYLGVKTYATVANEFTIIQGKATECALVGVTKVEYEVSRFSLGVTGLGGGCFASTSSGGAASVQGFMNYRIGKSNFSVVGTGNKILTSNGNSAVKLTIGVSFGK